MLKTGVTEYHGWPTGLAGISMRHLRSVLPHASLIHIEGRTGQPLFLSFLLHGNETTSFRLLQTLARRYASARPARPMIIFVGNVWAAEAGLRRLPHQKDFNRVWQPASKPACTVERLAASVLETARSANLFASIDVHNTTGRNPHYGCVNVLRADDLALAAGVSDIGVYYETPTTTQSVAFSKFCPAITIECGQNGHDPGFDAVDRRIEATLAADRLTDIPPAAQTLTLYETLGRVTVKDGMTLSFTDAEANLMLPFDMEDRNFRPLSRGTVFGRLAAPVLPLTVSNAAGTEISDRFFSVSGDTLVLREDIVPSMITHDEDIIFDDCLCYLMQPITPI